MTSSAGKKEHTTEHSCGPEKEAKGPPLSLSELVQVRMLALTFQLLGLHLLTILVIEVLLLHPLLGLKVQEVCELFYYQHFYSKRSIFLLLRAIHNALLLFFCFTVLLSYCPSVVNILLLYCPVVTLCFCCRSDYVSSYCLSVILPY